jgi:hypothetical protein
MTKSDDALEDFKNGFTCSSAVFSAFSEEMGLDSETAKKIAVAMVQVSQRAVISAEQCPVRLW